MCESVDNISTLIEREQAWIDYFGDYNLAPAAGSTLGFKQSDEFKENQRKRMSGGNNPMFGKKRPEVGAILRKANTGKVLTEEHKQKCSAALKGKIYGPMSEDRKAKIGAANKNKIRTSVHRENMSRAQKNRQPVSSETREKLRIANSGFKHSQETKDLLRKLKTGVPLGPRAR